MKKLLLTAAVLLAGATAFAQNNWNVGDDISADIAWGDYSGQEQVGGFWQGTNATFDKNEWEIYQGSDVDRYQMVYMTAGVYTFKCQGYYRDGSNYDAAQNYYNGKSSKNAILYVETGKMETSTDAEGVETENFVATKTWSSPLCSQWVNEQTEQLFSSDDWQSDASYTVGETTYWAPNSMSGAQQYFAAGLYDKNEIKFIVMEDGFIKVGIRKPGTNIGSDWLCFTNFRFVYEGDAGEAAELMMAQDAYNTKAAEGQTLQDEITAAGYDGLAGLLNDDLINLDDELSSLESAQDYYDAVDKLEALYADYRTALESAGKLSSTIKNCEGIISTTSFAGKADFQAAIDAAKNIASADVYGLTSRYDYTNAFNNLISGRIEYLKTQEPKNGRYDFSRTINYPFFCNNEYTPTWDEEKGYYAYADSIETTFVSTYMEKDIPSILNENPSWPNLVSEVTWKNEDGTEGEWIYNHHCTSGWMGGIDNVTMQHGYTALGAWSGDPIGGYQELRQVVTGLPNGFYSMGALYINAGNEPNEGQYVYICPGNEPDDATMVKGQFTHKGTHWWWGVGNYPLYRTDDWENIQTNMVYVDGGKVTIGSRSNWFYAVTGFQLYYYGENPDFSSLLADPIAAVKANIESLTFAGDKAAVNAILAKIPETITTLDGYQDALATIDEASAYITTATSAINNFNDVTLPNFANASENAEEGSDESAIYTTAYVGVLSVGEGENDTYKDAVAAGNDYNAYVSYMAYFNNAKQYTSDADVAGKVKEQVEYLSANYANSAKLDEFKQALAVPYNKAVLANLDYTKATADNPIDVTALIINPKYDELSKGWSGDMTVDSLGIVERWNVNSDINQTIHALPAGAYKLTVQAFYRDGGDAGTAYNNFWYNQDEETGEWANQNAKLYANDSQANIVSIVSESFAQRSYTQYVDKWVLSEEGDADGNDVYLPHWVYQFKNESTDAETGAVTYEDLTEETCSNDYPWDTKVEDLDEIMFYPSSLRGAARRFEKNPEAYHNEITVYVPEQGSLKFGIKKDVLIGSDWIVMDNWKLYYLGDDESVSVSSVKANTGVENIYSISGVRQNGLKKGINIVKQNGRVVKQLVK